MLNLFKKVVNWARGVLESVATLREEEATPVQYEEAPKHTVKGTAYWAEYVEHQKEQERIRKYFHEQEKLSHRLDPEAVRMWRENNQRLDELLPKIRPARKPQLRVIKGNSVSA